MQPATLPESKPNDKPAKPRVYYSRLEGDVELTLHTRMAQSLLQGVRVNGKMSLWHFASQIRVLRDRHKNKDPQAGALLLKIEEKITEIHEKMQVMEVYYNERIGNMRGLKIRIFRNPTPMQFTLKFLVSYSFAAAALLPDLDYLTCQMYTLKRLGQKLDSESLPILAYRGIRGLFELPYEKNLIP